MADQNVRTTFPQHPLGIIYCPICSGFRQVDYSLTLVDKGIDVYRCNGCNVVIINPFDEHGKRYIKDDLGLG